MASARFEFDDRQWTLFFRQFSKGFDWSGILRAAASTEGIKDIVQHFKDEAGPEGPWKGRSEETQYRYTKVFGGEWKTPRGFSRSSFNPSNKLLQQSGKLRGSILPSGIKKMSPTSVMVFSNVVYSGAHDQGTKHIPQREFMYLSAGAKDRMMDAIMKMATGI